MGAVPSFEPGRQRADVACDHSGHDLPVQGVRMVPGCLGEEPLISRADAALIARHGLLEPGRPSGVAAVR